MIHTYHDEMDVDIEINIEFNNDCISQYKCTRTNQSFAMFYLQCFNVLLFCVSLVIAVITKTEFI